MRPFHSLTATRLRRHVRYFKTTGRFKWKVAPDDRKRVHIIDKYAGNVRKCDGYLQFTMLGKKYLAHRLAWLYVYGRWPRRQIDHRNGVRHDNRIKNLRQASNKQNQENRILHHRNKSGVTGVFWHKTQRQWHAFITSNRCRKHLGSYPQLSSAVRARRNAERRYFSHRRFARARS